MGNSAKVLTEILANGDEYISSEIYSFTGKCQTSRFRQNFMIIPIGIAYGALWIPDGALWTGQRMRPG